MERIRTHSKKKKKKKKKPIKAIIYWPLEDCVYDRINAQAHESLLVATN